MCIIAKGMFRHLAKVCRVSKHMNIEQLGNIAAAKFIVLSTEGGTNLGREVGGHEHIIYTSSH